MDVINHLSDEQIRQLHTLYQNEWWAKGRTLEETQQCVTGSSICFAVVDEQGTLKGFSRVLTDTVFKALIFDVIVASDTRGTGVGDLLINSVKSHEKLSAVKHFELYCRPDLEAFYERHGFSKEVGGMSLMRRVVDPA